MRFMASKAFTVLYRRMHHLLFPKRIVAFCAECWHLGLQLPTLSTQYWMHLVFSIVTCWTIFFLHRGVHFLEADDRLVTRGDRA